MSHYSPLIRDRSIQALDKKVVREERRVFQEEHIRQQLDMVIGAISISIFDYQECP